METILPNYQKLEDRVKQLADTIRYLKEHGRSGDNNHGMSEKSKKLIEEKIRNLLDLLEEF